MDTVLDGLLLVETGLDTDAELEPLLLMETELEEELGLSEILELNIRLADDEMLEFEATEIHEVPDDGLEEVDELVGL